MICGTLFIFIGLFKKFSWGKTPLFLGQPNRIAITFKNKCRSSRVKSFSKTETSSLFIVEIKLTLPEPFDHPVVAVKSAIKLSVLAQIRDVHVTDLSTNHKLKFMRRE
jgi:hypothetical protein